MISAVLCCAAAGSASAQQQMMQPSPIEETHPQAQRARAVADLLLVGKTADAETYLRAHGTPEWTSGPLQTELGAVVRHLANGPYTVDGLDRLRGDLVAVRLRDAGGAVNSALLVTLDSESGDRVRGVRAVPIQLR